MGVVREEVISQADLTVSDAALLKPLAGAEVADIEAIGIPDFTRRVGLISWK
jgi:hypothetical protein